MHAVASCELLKDRPFDKHYRRSKSKQSNMRVSPTTVALLASISLQAPSFSLGFHVSPSTGGRVAAPTRNNVSGHQHRLLRLGALFSTTTEDNETTSATATQKKKKKLGLLTFDLGKYCIITSLNIHIM